METMIGSSYSAVSVLIVYHLFSLTRWLDSLDDLEREWHLRLSRISTTSLELRTFHQRVERARFPLWGVLIVAIAAGAILVGGGITSYLLLTAYGRQLGIGTAVVLLLVVIFASLRSAIEGRRIRRRLLAYVPREHDE